MYKNICMLKKIILYYSFSFIFVKLIWNFGILLIIIFVCELNVGMIVKFGMI